MAVALDAPWSCTLRSPCDLSRSARSPTTTATVGSSFLKSPDVLAVVRALGHHPTVADALSACGVEERRWPAFVAALDSLEHSEVVRGR